MFKFVLYVSFVFSSIQFSLGCTHTIRLTDTFGDGWNSGIVKIQVNGVDVLTNVGSTFTTGSGPVDFTFSANTGDNITVIRTTNGSYPEEMRIEILDCGGTSLLGPIEPIGGAGNSVAGSCPASMSISSSTVTQSSTASLTNCETNAQIVRLAITTTGSCSPISVTQIQTNFSGSASDANVSSAKFYYTGTSTTFSTGTLFGTGTASTSTYNINGSQVLSNGTNYFWLVYTLNNTGTVGTTVDGVISQFTAAAVNYNSGSTPSISATNPAGTRTITVCLCPGGVFTGLETWVKSDVGITGTTPITAISNQNSSGTAITINGSPNLNNSATTYNYNPYIDLTAPSGTLSDGAAANRQFLKLSGYNDLDGISYTSLFWVCNLTVLARTNTHLATVDNVTNGFPGDGTLHGHVSGGVAALFDTGYDGDFSGAGIWQRNGTNVAATAVHTSTKQILSASSAGGGTTINRFFGGQRDQFDPATFSGDPRDFKGPAAELIGFSSSITATERQKIHSYLAIKYGVTLATNYLSPTGVTIFTNSSPYNNVIIGIGRDDSEALYQRQSHSDDDSVRLYINTLAATNSGNAGTFTSDISYVIMGANTGFLKATSAANTEVPAGCGLYSRLAREWKITRTNCADNIHLNVKLASGAAPTSVTVSQLRLLIDDDGNFANGGTSCYANGDGSGITFTYSNPVITITGISTTHFANNGTSYFTIGSTNSATPLPIELFSFTGVKKEGYNELIWVTSSELNNDYFTIEKTTNGETFNVVGDIDGAGNSIDIKHYSMLDLSPSNLINYYRLKQTDYNGDYVYSEVISIDNRKSTENKEINYITNILGQEVNEYYKGLIIIYYSDGSILKVIK